MSSTQMRSENATQNPKDAMVDLKLESSSFRCPTSIAPSASTRGWVRLDADFATVTTGGWCS